MLGSGVAGDEGQTNLELCPVQWLGQLDPGWEESIGLWSYGMGQ